MCSMSRLYNYSHVPPYYYLPPLDEGEGRYLVAAEPCLPIPAAISILIPYSSLPIRTIFLAPCLITINTGHTGACWVVGHPVQVNGGNACIHWSSHHTGHLVLLNIALVSQINLIVSIPFV